MRHISVMLIGAVAATMFAAPALANGGNSGDFARPLANSDRSAELQGGSWSFDSWPGTQPHPGFYYWGKLKDNKADGDWVYTRGKVDGYGWAGGAAADNHGGYPSRVAINQKVWGGDPPHEGKIQVCRHRTGIIPNICTESAWKIAAGT